MSSIAQIRHHLTKHPVVDSVLTWFQHRDINQHDTLIASYPRSGSTWLRFMLCTLLTGGETSFELVDEVLADIGHHSKAPSLLPNSGRLLKTHEPYRVEYQRAIYLVRDVRDVIISEYTFSRRTRQFGGDFDRFFEQFMQGRVNRYGFWGDHVQSWLHYAENQPGEVLVIGFEDLRRDTAGVVSKCMEFLEVACTQAQIVEAVAKHNLASMQEKEDQAKKFQTNAEGLRFITDGVVGKGKQQLTQQQLGQLVAATQADLERLGYLVPPQSGIVPT